MSRKKASKVFKVTTEPREQVFQKIFVIARHRKGAVSVAEAHGHTVPKSPSTPFDVIEVEPEFAKKAINREKQDG